MITVEVNKQEEEESIFRKGNLVIADNGLIVLSDGEKPYSDTTFSGTVINKSSAWDLGDHKTIWAK